jgi:hypothetical protein
MTTSYPEERNLRTHKSQEPKHPLQINGKLARSLLSLLTQILSNQEFSSTTIFIFFKYLK